MTMTAAATMKNAAETQHDVPAPVTENRGILTNIKAADLPDESLVEFSNAPFEFENTAALLWQDTQTVYVHACTANRFSENYLTFCGMLEKNIKQLGSLCLTKAVLEQNGMSFPNLSKMSIKELVCMVSFHLRKAHAALEGIYQDNNILGMTYLNWEFRWAGLGNRLKATEVKIQNIRDGKVNTDAMLKQAEAFKGEPRTNVECTIMESTPARTAMSLPAAPNALPINGSMARLMLGLEKEAGLQARLELKERQRKLKEAERLEREANRLSSRLNKPILPTKEMKALSDQVRAENLRKMSEEIRKELSDPEAVPEAASEAPIQTQDAEPEPGYITEAEARKRLMDDAMRRKDQEAIMAIPLESSAEIHERWERHLERVEREAMVSQNVPSGDVRKKLREKRKKRK